MNPIRTIRTALLVLALPAWLAAQPVDRSELQALRAQVQQLEQQLKVLSRQLELKEEAAATAAPTTPKITINDKGYIFASSDAANSIRLRGLVQLDNRLFFDDGGGILNNAFVLRRARMITEGVLARNYGYQFAAEFAGSSVSILDVNFYVNLAKNLQLKVGKFKEPIGLEQIQSDSWTFFNERSIATNLVPSRDLGIQLSSDLFGGKLNLTGAVFNGLPDGGNSTNTDFDEEKDLVGRVFATPFKNDAGSPLQGLAFGVGASAGRQKGASGHTGGYRTDGQQTFFAYNAAVVADGLTWRVSPQFDYRHGAFGLLGEYTRSTVNLRPTATGAKSELTNKAWQLAAGYVLTGEDSTPNGVSPRVDFAPAAGTWGAFELVGRFARVDIDDATFPTFASAAANADEAKSVGLGLNWYLSKTAMLKIDLYHTDFGFSSLAPAIPTAPIVRQDEKAFTTRFQLAF